MPGKKMWTRNALDQLAQTIKALPPAPVEEHRYAKDAALKYLSTIIRDALRKRVDVKEIGKLLNEGGIKIGATRIAALAKEVEAEPEERPVRERKPAAAIARKPREVATTQPAATTKVAPEVLSAAGSRFTPAQDRLDV